MRSSVIGFFRSSCLASFASLCGWHDRHLDFSDLFDQPSCLRLFLQLFHSGYGGLVHVLDLFKYVVVFYWAEGVHSVTYASEAFLPRLGLAFLICNAVMWVFQVCQPLIK